MTSTKRRDRGSRELFWAIFGGKIHRGINVYIMGISWDILGIYIYIELYRHNLYIHM